MIIQSYEQRVLIPENGKFLYNAEARAISDKVFLGINANADDWQEITADEKTKLEAEWETENEVM